MAQTKKISVSLKLDPDQKKLFDKQRKKHKLTQQAYLYDLVMLDMKFDLIDKLGSPLDDKFIDDDFDQFAARVEIIKPIFDKLINIEQLPERVDVIIQYLAAPEPEQKVTDEEVAPSASIVTEGQVDPIQAAAIAQARKTVSLPGNPSSLLPKQIFDPPENPHMKYARAKQDEIGSPTDMRVTEIEEAKQELAERKMILENLNIKKEE